LLRSDRPRPDLTLPVYAGIGGFFQQIYATAVEYVGHAVPPLAKMGARMGTFLSPKRGRTPTSRVASGKGS
jgi:hypothetical protein